MEEKSNMVELVELLMEIEANSEEGTDNNEGVGYFITEDGKKIIY